MRRITRVAQVALVVNAVLHSIGMVGFFVGLDPHAGQASALARRAAAAGVAGVLMMIVVARRLPRDGALIVLPIAFVLGNLVASILDFAARDPKALAPASFETAFLVVYALHAARCRPSGPS